MVRREIMSKVNELNSVGELKGIKFAYAVNKNKKKFLKELKEIAKLMEMSEEFKIYEKKRVEICEKFCEKDEEGKAIVKNNAYAGLKENAEFDSAMDALSEENKELINARKKQISEYNNFLNEEFEIDIYKIKLEDVPSDISVNQLKSIEFMIEE